MVQRNGKKNLCKNKQETQTHTHTSARGGQRKNVAKTENAKKERERRKNKNAAATAMMKTKKKHRSRHWHSPRNIGSSKTSLEFLYTCYTYNTTLQCMCVCALVPVSVRPCVCVVTWKGSKQRLYRHNLVTPAHHKCEKSGDDCRPLIGRLVSAGRASTNRCAAPSLAHTSKCRARPNCVRCVCVYASWSVGPRVCGLGEGLRRDVAG